MLICKFSISYSLATEQLPQTDMQYTLLFNKNKLNKNIEAEIAWKTSTIWGWNFFQQTNIRPRRQCKRANVSFQNSGSLLYSLPDIYITLKLCWTETLLRLLAFTLASLQRPACKRCFSTAIWSTLFFIDFLYFLDCSHLLLFRTSTK